MAQKIPEEAHDRMLSKTLDPTGQLMRIENSNLSDTMAFSLVTVRRSSQTPTDWATEQGSASRSAQIQPARARGLR
ncbi:hypothetical protein, variant [Blastomyces dermatitidis ER-3]|uniref:Uncharacterized protein n=1 Tax=Ajellomyces dermatitidis (strain ER-3 / ATCC MYA-2586) TaxID=559297 RepID=A0ABX2VQM6_AJEDR|nr:uncharacterized protein BDCG_16164 [Blastomyces dermatitidis ER-3]XP_045279210.1 hypothetical protein, variant [Blastomyces dermatitidis ER-3]OAS99481.1 hypothetical protein BDCG_16164 [Blastomyces dermatitidis ER-3]OAS99482.1 hypothetical protein, variant [Blastomyces dermatitidis ER-3]